MSNPFAHVELTTSDVKAAKTFYSHVFDWKFTELPEMTYLLFDTGSPPGGGIMQIPEPSVPVAWTVYITVSDVAATAARVKELGGKVWKDRTEVPDMGWFAVLADPQGGVFGVWEDAKKGG